MRLLLLLKETGFQGELVIVSSEDIPASTTLLTYFAVRGPCPMMNTLANHGFIPRNGDNLTRENVVHGLTTGLNFDPAVANLMWEQAIFINPTPNATFFTLDQLNVHNVLEHDASLR